MYIIKKKTYYTSHFLIIIIFSYLLSCVIPLRDSARLHDLQSATHSSSHRNIYPFFRELPNGILFYPASSLFGTQPSSITSEMEPFILRHPSLGLSTAPRPPKWNSFLTRENIPTLGAANTAYYFILRHPSLGLSTAP